MTNGQATRTLIMTMCRIWTKPVTKSKLGVMPSLSKMGTWALTRTTHQYIEEVFIMTEKKSIRIAYYVLAECSNLNAGYWKTFVTGVWGDEIHMDDNGWFSLWANGECVLADAVDSLHAVKPTCADIEFEYVKDIR